MNETIRKRSCVSLEWGDWKSATNGNSLVAYPTVLTDLPERVEA